MKQESRDLMGLFVKKAKIVSKSLWLKSVNEQGMKFAVEWAADNPAISYDIVRPDDEFLRALILTLRMFQQNNDPVSLGNMAKLLDDPGISENWKTYFRWGRKLINDFLNGLPIFEIIIHGHTLTAREIIDTIVYGEHAHSTSDKLETIAHWKSYGPLYEFILAASDNAIGLFATRIGIIGEACELELNGDMQFIEPDYENTDVPVSPPLMGRLTLESSNRIRMDLLHDPITGAVAPLQN